MHAKPIGVMLRPSCRRPARHHRRPFAGSGSTLVAARNLGRKAIGVVSKNGTAKPPPDDSCKL